MPMDSPLREDSVDVAIIGAGFSGTMAAIHLQRTTTSGSRSIRHFGSTNRIDHEADCPFGTCLTLKAGSLWSDGKMQGARRSRRDSMKVAQYEVLGGIQKE
jgi:hypothetical protein